MKSVDELEKMFKMKQDDWIDACKEIDRLAGENQKLKERVEYLIDRLDKIAHDTTDYFSRSTAREALASSKGEDGGKDFSDRKGGG